jgi:hypothetical protein
MMEEKYLDVDEESNGEIESNNKGDIIPEGDGKEGQEVNDENDSKNEEDLDEAGKGDKFELTEAKTSSTVEVSTIVLAKVPIDSQEKIDPYLPELKSDHEAEKKLLALVRVCLY